MGDVSQDVPHKMNLAPLPAAPEEGLPARLLQTRMGVRDTQPDLLHSPSLEIGKEGSTGLFRFGQHGLTS